MNLGAFCNQKANDLAGHRRCDRLSTFKSREHPCFARLTRIFDNNVDFVGPNLKTSALDEHRVDARFHFEDRSFARTIPNIDTPIVAVIFNPRLDLTSADADLSYETRHGRCHCGMMRAAIMREIWRRIREAFEESMRQQITALGFIFTLTVVVVGLAAFASGNNLLFLLLAALLSTLLISGFISRLGLAGLEFDLQVPPHVVARREIAAKIKVRNRKFLMPSFSLHLSGAADTGLREEIYIPLVPAGTTVTELVPLYFRKRGQYKNKTFSFSTRFPFGFTFRRANVRLEQEVLVYPSIDPRPGFESLLGDIAGDIESIQRGRGHDFYRIRPYILDESARHVDWRATAHTGDLQIREYTREQDPAVTIFLDLEIDDSDWFEVAVDLSAFLVWRLAEKGARIRFMTQRWMPEDADVYGILKYLAVVDPSRGLKPAIPNEYSLQIALSTRPQELAEAGWSLARIITPDSLRESASSE